jgi:hypothetical protein
MRKLSNTLGVDKPFYQENAAKLNKTSGGGNSSAGFF